jgi:hypothetical protein
MPSSSKTAASTFPTAAHHALAYLAAILLVFAAHLAVGAQAALMFA